MKKAIIICQNPFQTMTAIIMRMQQLEDRVCDILITNRSSDMERRATRLRETGLFRNVFFIPTLDCWNKGAGLRHHIGQTRCLLCGCHLPVMREVPDDYDEIFTLFTNCVTAELVRKMQRRGIQPTISLVEEGYGCYMELYGDFVLQNKKRAAVEKICSILRGKKAPNAYVKDIYLYNTGFMMWDPPVEMKLIKKPDVKGTPRLKEMINFVFDYEGEAQYFENKVTFFEGCDYQDSGDDRDEELIVGLAERVGKENVVVKLHPRTKVNRFERYGITTTDKLGMKQGVPWEVVVMNMADEANCVFASVNSGAVITYTFLFEKGYHTVMMIKCLDGSGGANDEKRMRFLEQYSRAMPDVLALPESREELFAVVGKWYRKQ